VLSYWDSAAVVYDSNPAVFGDGDVDGVAVTGERFVYGVINNFIDQVVQTSWACGTDVHSGAFANCLETF
jgi:hypothetical protein